MACKSADHGVAGPTTGTDKGNPTITLRLRYLLPLGHGIERGIFTLAASGIAADLESCCKQRSHRCCSMSNLPVGTLRALRPHIRGSLLELWPTNDINVS